MNCRSAFSIWVIILFGGALFFSSCSGCVRGGKELLKPRNLKNISKAIPKNFKPKSVPIAPVAKMGVSPITRQVTKNAALEFQLIDKSGKVLLNQPKLVQEAYRQQINNIFAGISDDIVKSLETGKAYSEQQIKDITIKTLRKLTNKKDLHYFFNLNIPTGKFHIDYPLNNNQVFRGATNLYTAIMAGATGKTVNGLYYYSN